MSTEFHFIGILTELFQMQHYFKITKNERPALIFYRVQVFLYNLIFLNSSNKTLNTNYTLATPLSFAAMDTAFATAAPTVLLSAFGIM